MRVRTPPLGREPLSTSGFWVHCCAHDHDSGSLRNLCLRSGKIQEWREMGPVEENKNSKTNTKNLPQHHKTGPNLLDHVKGETVKRAPALIVSKVTPALSTSSATCSQ